MPGAEGSFGTSCGTQELGSLGLGDFLRKKDFRATGSTQQSSRRVGGGARGGSAANVPPTTSPPSQQALSPLGSWLGLEWCPSCQAEEWYTEKWSLCGSHTASEGNTYTLGWGGAGGHPGLPAPVPRRERGHSQEPRKGGQGRIRKLHARGEVPPCFGLE